MLRKAILAGLLLAGLLGGVAGPGWGMEQEERVGSDRAGARPPHGGNGSLDEERNALYYVQTTDYGASWSPLLTAAELGALAPDNSGIGEFSAVATSGNTFCYAVPLLGGTVPGIYAFPGPAFTPVLVMAEGTNTFATVRAAAGWADIGRTPNGDLFVIILGEANMQSTLWGVKSTDQGASWSAPFVITADNWLLGGGYPHIAAMNSTTQCFVLLQDYFFAQYFIRFPTTGGAGVVTSLGVTAGSELSYSSGNCQPIAYDPVHDALYAVFRNADVSAVSVYSSDNQGTSWMPSTVPGVQRYPSVTLNAATQMPYVFSNNGVPSGAGQPHYAWLAYDDGGYHAGLWTEHIPYASVPFQGPPANGVIYMNEGYWWDADHGVSSHNYWGAQTPNGLYTSRTTDGGATWVDFGVRWTDSSAALTAGTIHNSELIGGANGVAWVVMAARRGDPAPQHFVAVDSTAQGCVIVVDSALWEGRLLTRYDEIAVYDDTLCVGAAALTGAGEQTLRAWRGDANGHDGYLPGDTMRFRLWRHQNEEERAALATITAGGGLFADDSVTHVRLDAVLSPPDIDLRDSVLNLPPSPLGEAQLTSFDVYNTGDCRLTILSVTSTNPQFVPDPPIATTVTGGSLASIFVVFTPTDLRPQMAFIRVESDDQDEPLDSIQICGQGVVRPPSPFSLTAPADRARLTTSTTRLRWRPSDDPDTWIMHYSVWLDTLPELTTAWLHAAAIVDTSCAVAQLQDGHTYFWTVFANDDNTAGTWAREVFSFSVELPSAVTDAPPALPREFRLLQNTPNPFNPQTEIGFELPAAADVRLVVYNTLGQEVATLATGHHAPGRCRVLWDGRDAAAGVYFYRLDAGPYSEVKKMLFIK